MPMQSLKVWSGETRLMSFPVTFRQRLGYISPSPESLNEIGFELTNYLALRKTANIQAVAPLLLTSLSHIYSERKQKNMHYLKGAVSLRVQKGQVKRLSAPGGETCPTVGQQERKVFRAGPSER